MSGKRLLLFTDMDRTIIPNGPQEEHPAAREQFKTFCGQPGICLVYVTGRRLELVTQAIAEYALPQPAFAVTDVGSKIYRDGPGSWEELPGWEEQLAADWHGRTHGQLEQALRPIEALTLQEEAQQSRFKLSYYLDLAVDKDQILQRMQAALAELGVAASLIWSVDDLQQIGLIDVLPENATKLHGLRFVQHQLGFADSEVLFAGDSGNDLPVLVSPVRSVLVANAREELKNLAVQLAQRNGHAETLYLAQPAGFSLGGNYAAGVLQGIRHFSPEFHPELQAQGLLP